MNTKKLLDGFFIILIICSVSCSNLNHSKTITEPQPRKTLSERLSQKNGFKQDENGQWIPQSNQRSIYDTDRENSNFKGKFKSEKFQTKEFEKTSWWGKNEFSKTEYQGNTDASKFQNRAKQSGQIFYQNELKALDEESKFQTKKLAKKSARESSIRKTLTEPNSDYLNELPESYPVPAIIDWQEQRKMSIEDAKGILGR